ncbi:UNVERIFIED_CONTAM: hypothetical protein PYX00_011856 [Menopon gallinae]|uniref:Uncharacterized protein n=1 Tax=Menopon gallinae TaxID=328185 RepID=A0AAW2H8X5_9NEOP
MLAVIDANCFIRGRLNEYKYDQGYTTSLVWSELRDENTKSNAALHLYKIEIRDPAPCFVKKVLSAISGMNLFLSDADISLVALCLELNDQVFDVWIDSQSARRTVMCITEDRGILQALSHLNIASSNAVQNRTYKIRCYACFSMYDIYMDFCKKCGYQTLTRVSVTQVGDGWKLHLKKNFCPRPRTLRGAGGKAIRSADQKEYDIYLKQKKQKERALFRRERRYCWPAIEGWLEDNMGAMGSTLY